MEGYDVVEVVVMNLIGEGVEFVVCVVNVGEVGYYGEVEIGFEECIDLCGVFVGVIVGVVGNGYEVGGDVLENFGGGVEGGDVGFVFGWEKFEGMEWVVLCEKGNDGLIGSYV